MARPIRRPYIAEPRGRDNSTPLRPAGTRLTQFGGALTSASLPANRLRMYETVLCFIQLLCSNCGPAHRRTALRTKMRSIAYKSVFHLSTTLNLGRGWRHVLEGTLGIAGMAASNPTETRSERTLSFFYNSETRCE